MVSPQMMPFCVVNLRVEYAVFERNQVLRGQPHTRVTLPHYLDDVCNLSGIVIDPGGIKHTGCVIFHALSFEVFPD